MGIENQFVSDWSGWDEVETGTLQFYDCALRIEKFGSRVYNDFNGGIMTISFSEGVLTLYAPFTEDFLEYDMNITLSPVEGE
jgi:hypothetical protein